MLSPIGKMVNGVREWETDIVLSGNQGVVWIPTRGQDVWFDVYIATTATVTLYKTQTQNPVDGTVGEAVTHDTLTATGSSLSLGSWRFHGVAVAITSGAVKVRVRGMEVGG